MAFIAISLFTFSWVEGQSVESVLNNHKECNEKLIKTVQSLSPQQNTLFNTKIKLLLAKLARYDRSFQRKQITLG